MEKHRKLLEIGPGMCFLLTQPLRHFGQHGFQFCEFVEVVCMSLGTRDTRSEIVRFSALQKVIVLGFSLQPFQNTLPVDDQEGDVTKT